MKLINLFEDDDPYETDLHDDDIKYITNRLRTNMLHYADSTGLSDFKRVALANHASNQDIINILNDNKILVLNYFANHSKMLDTRYLLYHARILHNLGITWPELNSDALLAMAIQQHMNSLGIIDELRKSYRTLTKRVIEENKDDMLKCILKMMKIGNYPMSLLYTKVLQRLGIEWPQLNTIKNSAEIEELRLQKERDIDNDVQDEPYDW